MDIETLRIQIDQKILVEDDDTLEALIGLLLETYQALERKAEIDPDLAAIYENMKSVLLSL